MESKDKTGQVVDTEEKIKNLTAFRDSLRQMLSRPSVTVKDAIEIQGQLSEVQSQLDSETAGRKLWQMKQRRLQWTFPSVWRFRPMAITGSGRYGILFANPVRLSPKALSG